MIQKLKPDIVEKAEGYSKQGEMRQRLRTERAHGRNRVA